MPILITLTVAVEVFYALPSVTHSEVKEMTQVIFGSEIEVTTISAPSGEDTTLYLSGAVTWKIRTGQMQSLAQKTFQNFTLHSSPNWPFSLSTTNIFIFLHHFLTISSHFPVFNKFLATHTH